MKTTSENIYLVSRVIALERVNNELTQRQLTIQAESDAAVGKLLAELKIFNDYKALADELIDEQAGLIAEA